MTSMTVTQEPSTHRAWIRLPSQRHMDLMNPSPDAWTDRDLAVKLARTPRWAGESCWPRPLSVAQHSLMVLALMRLMSPVALTAAEELRELLHDAEEGFLGFDPISPLKQAFGAPFRAVADRLLACVFERYGVSDWDPQAYKLHKAADQAAAAGEAVHCVGWSRTEVVEVLGITMPIPDADPLAAIYGDKPWEPWSADLAEARFLTMLRDLVERAEAEEVAA